jgi:hypothetical protein
MNEIQQLRKYDPETGQDQNIYPVTKLKALGAGVSVIYDISAANNNQSYPDLQTALGIDGANIPQEYRKGGLTIKFIQSMPDSSDNKYVMYYFTGTKITGTQNPFLDDANWQRIDGTRIFEHSEVSGVSILPNVLNVWNNIESLTINSFKESQEDYINEYMLEFTVKGDDFTLTLPEGVRWIEEPTWENGYTYQVSIVNNLAVFAGWEDLTNE